MRKCGNAVFTILRCLTPEQSKTLLLIGILSVIVNLNMPLAETAMPSEVNTREAVKTVTMEMDENDKVSETEKIIAVTAPIMEAGSMPHITAPEVFDKAVRSGDKSFFLLSIQDAEDYRLGHVPGSVNIPYPLLARKDNLIKIPRDRKIVVIDYDGHAANATALFLMQLGYEAYPMIIGMEAWNAAGPGLGKRQPYTGSAGYAVSTENVAPPTVMTETPEVRTGKSTLAGIIIARTDAYLSSKQSLMISARDVYERNTVEKNAQGYFLLSIQTADDYLRGHVPGAMNIPFSEIAKRKNLEKLPHDKKIIVICYIGHYAGAVTMFLNQLGYDAYDLQYGTMGWNDTTDGLGPRKSILPGLIRSQGYSTTAGSGR